jgi:hypothetical protein
MKKHILLLTTKWAMASFLVISVFGVGCAKKNDNPQAAPSADTTVAPDPNSSRNANPGLNYQSGSSALFTPDNYTTLAAYVGTHPINAPSNFQVNVNLRNLGSGRYGGVVQLSYYDNGNYYNGYFESGTGTVRNSVNYNGKSEAEFNQWFVSGGKRVFHGFFQDKYGAVILVVDDSLSNGDGGLTGDLNGKIYFKNFDQQNCALLPPLATSCGQSALKCWFTEAGPFDCRAFVVNGLVQTTSALYPGSGYRLLGKFTGLNYEKAFAAQ